MTFNKHRFKKDKAYRPSVSQYIWTDGESEIVIDATLYIPKINTGQQNQHGTTINKCSAIWPKQRISEQIIVLKHTICLSAPKVLCNGGIQRRQPAQSQADHPLQYFQIICEFTLCLKLWCHTVPNTTSNLKHRLHKSESSNRLTFCSPIWFDWFNQERSAITIYFNIRGQQMR